MLRAVLCLLTLSAFAVGSVAAADDKDKKSNDTTAGKSGDRDKKQTEAKITEVDPKKGTITVKMKGKNGKETERTFTLTRDIRYFDDTGRVAAIDVFRSGNDVLIVEAEGKLKEIRKHKGGSSDNNKNNK